MKKWLLRIVLLIAVLLLAIAGSWLYTWLTSPVPLEVSRETTVVEGPLREDGTVDYVAAINAEESEGVKPSNNVFVGIAKLMPADEWGPSGIREGVFEKLGVEKPGKQAVSLTSFKTYAKRRSSQPNPGAWGTRNEEEVAEDNQMSEGMSEEYQQFNEEYGPPDNRSSKDADSRDRSSGKLRWKAEWERFSDLDGEPWSTNDFPFVVEWLADQDAALNRLKAATEREQYWAPSLTKDEEEGVARILLPHVSEIKSMGRTLRHRAMMRATTGDLDGAISDVVALKRLSRHVAQELFTIAQMVAMATTAITKEVVVEIAKNKALSPSQAARLIEGLEAPPLRVGYCSAIDKGRRFMALDMLQQLRHAGVIDERMRGTYRGSGIIERFLLELRNNSVETVVEAVDLNRAMRRVNKVFDRAVKALSVPKRNERLQRIQEFEKRLEARQRRMNRTSRWVGLLLARRSTITDWVSDMLLARTGPSTLKEASVNRIDPQLMQNRLERLAIAIAGYHARHGQYPETLEALVPEWLNSVPQDIFTDGNEPVRYRVEDEQVTVYSVGVNGKDEDGTKAEGSDEGDLVIEWKRANG